MTEFVPDKGINSVFISGLPVRTKSWKNSSFEGEVPGIIEIKWPTERTKKDGSGILPSELFSTNDQSK